MKRMRNALYAIAFLSMFVVDAAMGAQPGAWKADWDKTVEAAKKEGQLVIYGSPDFEGLFGELHKKYPEIKITGVFNRGADVAKRLMAERRGEKYLADLYVNGMTTGYNVFYKAKVLDPIPPLLVLPEVTNVSKWWRGKLHYVDPENQYLLNINGENRMVVAFNTKLVNPAEIKSYWDLLNPKWKGKLLLPDVRTMGDSFWAMTSARLNLGDDIIKKLFVDQEPALSRDTRQIAEFMVRGRYPIALGVNPLLLSQFQRQGLGKNLKTFHFPEMDTFNSSSSTLWLVNRAPHPNAAKLFANWLLTKDAQIVWGREVETNSRRIGVEPGNPLYAVPRGAKLLQVDAEENLPEVVKTQDIAKAVIK